MKLDFSKIPLSMHDGIQGYVDHGWSPGEFFRAVLKNDLIGAAERADDVNKHCLYEYACLLYNEIPIAARGSDEKINAWCAAGGMDQYRKK